MKRLVLLLTGFLLAGCSLLPGMGDDEDNTAPPAELEAEQKKLKRILEHRKRQGKKGA